MTEQIKIGKVYIITNADYSSCDDISKYNYSIIGVVYIPFNFLSKTDDFNTPTGAELFTNSPFIVMENGSIKDSYKIMQTDKKQKENISNIGYTILSLEPGNQKLHPPDLLNGKYLLWKH